MTLAGRVGIITGGRDFWSRLICWWTKSPAHHVIVAIDDDYCASQEPGGTVKRPNRGHFPAVEWLPPQGAPEQMARVAYAAQLTVETKPRYNRPAFILAGLRAARWPIPLWMLELVEGIGMTCVMHADACHAAAGIELLPGHAVAYWPGEFTAFRDTADATV